MSGLSLRGLRNLWSHADDEDDYRDDYADDNDGETRASNNDHDYDNYERDTHAARDTRASNAPQQQPRVVDNGPAYGHGSHNPRRPRLVATAPIRSARAKNIYTLKPKGLDDAAIAADYLKEGTAVILNLEEVDRNGAIRIIDFMSGVCYGLENQGHAMKLGETIFLYTPGDFDISSDEVDYGENPDLFFKDVPVSSPAPVVAQTAVAQPVVQPSTPVAQPAPTVHSNLPGAMPIPSQPQAQGAPPPGVITPGVLPRAIPNPNAQPQSAVTASGYINPAVVPTSSGERRSWER
jgi:cell division inhibitor SepF